MKAIPLAVFFSVICIQSFSQATKIMIVRNNSVRAHHVIEVISNESTGCKGKWVVFYDSSEKKYDYDYRCDKGFLYYGSYNFINGWGDTTIWGQYVNGLPQGIFIQYNDFNKRLHYLTRYDQGRTIERKSYNFDEDNKVLLGVTITIDADSVNGTVDEMKKPWKRVYDSTGTILTYEEIKLSNALKRVTTYYPNGKVHEIFQVSVNASSHNDHIGRYEEFYDNGNRKTVGQNNFGGYPSGVWIYFDEKGKKSVKNFTIYQ